MSILIEIPKAIEDQLQARWGDVSQAAKEALAIESYRTRKISVGFLAKMLGMGVIEAEDWLKQREVPLNYSEEDLEADRRALSDVLGGAQR